MTTRWQRLGLGALIGLLSAAVAIGVGEAATIFVRPAASPIIVVGNRVILATPESVRRWAIRQFGTGDKAALLSGIYLGIALLAIVVGLLALYRLSYGLAGLAAFGAFGVYCALTTNAHRGSDTIPTLIATVAALAAMILLVQAVVGEPWGPADPEAPALANRRQFLQVGAGAGTLALANRRQFLQVGAGAGTLALVSGLGGWAGVQKRYDVSQARAGVRLPAPASPAAPLPAGAELSKSPVPFVTPNQDFYRIDTALDVPQLNPANWALNIHGLVDRPVRLTYADLLARPLIERWITLACVSNYVGGNLISTTRFLGAPLADILREAGVHPGADQLVSRSSDGMTIGTPTAVVMDGRDAMLAVGMNGDPLPVEHGFPVRMVVPGLYGYVSACKSIVDIEVTTFSAYDAYWVGEGWVQQAPVVLSSRIDAPRGYAQLNRGQALTIAGTAWDQHVGVGQVEVKIDSGAWEPARVGAVPSTDTWCQWTLPWTPTDAGNHTIAVRATDRDGRAQDSHDADPFPGAATGYHTISVTVHG